jgi:LPXTG-motif cell wall-anchored protein
MPARCTELRMEIPTIAVLAGLAVLIAATFARRRRRK